MFRREPCVAMVRVHDIIWTYYIGAAVGDQYHLTTIGETCYDLISSVLNA